MSQFLGSYQKILYVDRFFSRRIIPVTISLNHIKNNNRYIFICKEESKESELMALFNCLVNNCSNVLFKPFRKEYYSKNYHFEGGSSCWQKENSLVKERFDDVNYRW